MTSNTPQPNIEDEELRQQMRQIITSPMKSQISTSDIAVGMISSTGLGEKIAELTQLFHQYAAKREVKNWYSVSAAMPQEGEFVLARIEWSSGKPVYAVLEHKFLEDNSPWLYDGDELSFTATVTHWRRFAQLNPHKEVE